MKQKKQHLLPRSNRRLIAKRTNLKRKRARELGIIIGEYPTGKFNSITDVPGVKVGHSTIIKGIGKLKVGEGPIRTGVTAILPNESIFENRVVGSGFILNGAGEVSGLTQLMEWGIIETPILLTNTLSVGTCSEAIVKYMVKKHPGIGVEQDVIIPVVGECDDSWLNDIGGRHVRDKNVFNAIKNASYGPVEEGNVGGGTGMVTCDFKAGIGTSSRKIVIEDSTYILGILVMSNFGRMKDLRINGAPIGKMIEKEYDKTKARQNNYGSIIVVVGTNAPINAHQVARVCKRAALGIGRAGSFAMNGSGEIVIGFSNANSVPRTSSKMTYKMKVMIDHAIDPLYEAAVEATEEAILNSLFMAETMEGYAGHVAPEIPLEKVQELYKSFK